MHLVHRLKSKLRVLESAKQVRLEVGKSLTSQFWEILRLRFSKHKLGLEQYYEFGAYDPQWKRDDQRAFIGWRTETGYGKILNHSTWNVVTNDKLTAYAIFSGLNLPYPRIKAVYHPHGRKFPGAENISDPADLASYLRNGIDFPFFSKPGHGASGKNSVACTGYDKTTDSMVLANGTLVDVDEYVQTCHPRQGVYPWEAGFIFQELIRPSADVAELFGPVVPGMRVIVMNPDGPPKIHRVFLKIPAAGSMTDNFGKIGETGAIVAELDPLTGKILHAQQGVAPEITILEKHPQTRAQLVGFKIPNWEDYLEVLFRATKAFPAIRLQHWDIAVSDSGPVIYEMNTFGAFGLPQIAARRGFYDQSFGDFMSKLEQEYPEYKKK